jgi:preprotein translocase subunit Sec63
MPDIAFHKSLHVTWLFSLPDITSFQFRMQNAKSQVLPKILIERILLRDQINLTIVFRLHNRKNVYSFNCLLNITTCFGHPAGHCQVIQYLQVLVKMAAVQKHL